MTLADAVAAVVAKYSIVPGAAPSRTASVGAGGAAAAAGPTTPTPAAAVTPASAVAAAAAAAAATAASHRPPPGADTGELKAGRKARRYASMLLAKLMADPATPPAAAAVLATIAGRLDEHAFARPPPVGSAGWSRQAWPFDVDAFVVAVHAAFLRLWGLPTAAAAPAAAAAATGSGAGPPSASLPSQAPPSTLPSTTTVAERQELRRLVDDFDQAMSHVPFVPARIPLCRYVTGSGRRAVQARLALDAAERRLADRTAAAAAPRLDAAAQAALARGVAALSPPRMRALIRLVARVTRRDDLAAAADVTLDIASLDDAVLVAMVDHLAGVRPLDEEVTQVASLRSALARKEAAAAREERELVEPITTKVKVQRRFQAQVHVPGWAVVAQGGAAVAGGKA